MGARTPETVDFDRLTAALTDYHAAYLVTVDDNYLVHMVDVAPVLNNRALDVGPVGGKTRRNIEKRSTVTLLWPPREHGGYSLIVDGTAQFAEAAGADDTDALLVTPIRALLHRKADPAGDDVRHDCVVF